MNYNKTIKDLRQLNGQLKGQYSDEQNRNYCLQCKIDKLEKENQQLKDLIVEKNNQLNDMQSQHTDYTQVNILKMKLETSEKARKEAIKLINSINDWEVCSKYDCMYKDDVLDVLKILDIDKGE